LLADKCKGSGMRIVPVIDLMNGIVVRGVGGRREEYRPIVSRIARDAAPQTVARALAEQFSLGTVYVADLDAILGGTANLAAYRQIVSAGLRLWLDAGVGSVVAARELSSRLSEAEIEAEMVDIVVGMESLDSSPALDELLRELSPERLIFSLDLKAGRPLSRIAAWRERSPSEIARDVLSRGIRRLIVLDLAAVGMGGGTNTLDLCRDLRDSYPDVELTSGGGVRGIADLQQLAASGISAALVASALHDGRLTPGDLAEFSRDDRR
jgi:phosphoribosylformimino-5-aminoimidazole carboxamide ribotide isomerase